MVKYMFSLLLLTACFTVKPMLEKQDFSEQEYQTYCAARCLANAIFDVAELINRDETKCTQIEYQKDENYVCNVEGKKTKQGISLEFNNGLPWVIVTPWGEYSFAQEVSSTAVDEGLIVQMLSEKVEMDYKKKSTLRRRQNSSGKIDCVGGLVVKPVKSLKKDKSDLKLLQRKWNAMTEQYNNRSNETTEEHN